MSDGADRESRAGLDVAIIGVAGRFPGAPDVATFWRNLCEGVESIAVLSDAELRSAGVDDAVFGRPDYVRARALLDDIDLFDAELFGVSPREAAVLDPQHRLFLECAWQAFEHAGYDPDRAGGKVGVYAGSSLSGYLFNVFPTGARLQSAADMAALLALDKDFLTTLVSYKLNLEGPSIAVQTACSTSLVAIHLACQGLLLGECDFALAGGVSITVPQSAGYLYQEGAIASPDGHCRPFDAGAAGTVGGSGVGVVLLRRLEDAVAAGDFIVAVIKGSAVNNDGRQKVGYTAPRVEGQARVIRSAHAAAGATPDSIGYVEAHGTGTPLGDPIEVAALTQAFRAGTDRSGFCALGSVKSNIGHLDAAAGVTGLIKAALAVRAGVVPPSLHFATPNPAIDFGKSPFFVAAKRQDWPRADLPRRAGVSAFGLGGTNAHVVLEAPPAAPARKEGDEGIAGGSQLLVLSARSPESLQVLSERLAAALASEGDLALADVAHTLAVGRRAFPQRRAVVANNRPEAVEALRHKHEETALSGIVGASRPIVFLFPGQGAQEIDMGRALYETEPGFRADVDRCAAALVPLLGEDIRALVYPGAEAREEAGRRLDETRFTQPVLFVVEYALARLWMEWGVTPEAMIGHSLGEYVAACLSGCLSLEDALTLVAARGRLMQATPEGGMLAVFAAEADVRRWTGPELDLAAVNGPAQCVLSGSVAAIETATLQIEAAGIRTRRLRTSRAFHSHLMEEAVAAFRAVLAQVTLRTPRIPWVSNVTGTWMSAHEAQDPAYWARHLREPVRFGPGLDTLWQRPERMGLEVGPGATLGRLARLEGRDVSVPAGLDRPALLRSLGELWVAGAPVDFERAYRQARRRRVPLPGVPLERKRYWIDRDGPPEADGSREAAFDEWFYVPSWKRDANRLSSDAPAETDSGDWILFSDRDDLGQTLARRLAARSGQRIVLVRSGLRFERTAPDAFVLRPGQPEDYESLVRDLAATGHDPRWLLHAFCLDRDLGGKLDVAAFEDAQAHGAASVLWLARAFGARAAQAGARSPAGMFVLASGLCEVTGRETLSAVHAPLLGVCRSIAAEYPALGCRLIDLEVSGSQGGEPGEMVDAIVAEACRAPADPVVAHRGRHRWLPTVVPLRLHEVPGRPTLLREGGVYLITGGLGGVGFAIAQLLADVARPRLVLVGRSASATDAGIADRVRDLEQRGAEVLVQAADVTDVAAMKRVIGAARARWGELAGVIHAAGVAEGDLIERLTPAGLAAELGAKARGALVLEEVVRECDLDFVLLCSSLTAASGGIAQAGYAAANSFLDGLAQTRARDERPAVIAVDFDRWRGLGMASRSEALARQAGVEAALGRGMSPEEGREVVRRVLGQPGVAHVLVSTTRLDDMPRDEVGAALASRLGLSTGERSGNATGAAAATATPLVTVPADAPADVVVARMRELWARAFGVATLDPGADFYALGGESLLALQILNRVRDVFGVEISLRDFFEHPSATKLAERVLAARADRSSGREPERAPALVALPRQARRLPLAASPEGEDA